MTISPKTIKKMCSMKDEGYTNKEIAKKCKVSERIVGKKLTNSQNQQYSTTKKISIDEMAEEMQVMGMKIGLQPALNETIDGWESIENHYNEDISLFYKIKYLSDKLKVANNIEKVQWIRDKYYEIMQPVWESMKAEAARAMEEEEERKKLAREKYDRQYNLLKRRFDEVITGANDIISYPLTSEEIDEIGKKLLPYGRNITDLAEPSMFTSILKSYGIPKDHAKIISNWWRQRIFREYANSKKVKR